MIKGYTFKGFTYQDYSFKNLKENEYEIPMGSHPGGFGFNRKFESHTGIDLYCKDGDEIQLLKSGVISDIGIFTGEKADSPWWEETYFIEVTTENEKIIYGEIYKPDKNIGEIVHSGDIIGKVKKVLKRDKGRPMSMLHLEYYIDDVLSNPLLLFLDLFNEAYPSKETYETLYKRFLGKSILNNFVFDYHNKNCLDLCGGAGYHSTMMHSFGGNVTYYDQSKIMISEEVKENIDISKIHDTVENINKLEAKFHIVVCQQAVNYWFNEENIIKLHNIIDTNGRFVFNTFVSMVDNINIKNINGVEEYSEKVDKYVLHIQDNRHRTIFKNITLGEYIEVLQKYFIVEYHQHKQSLLFICTKIN